MVSKSSKKEFTLFESIGRIINVLPKIASLTVGITAFAYLIGWLQAKAYFSAFGASWLLSELSVQSLLGYSWVPLTILLFFCYLTTLDLTEGKTTKVKNILFTLKYGRILIITIFIIQMVLISLKINSLQIFISYTLVFIMIYYSTSAYGYLILSLQNPKFKWDLPSTYLTFIILFCGLYLVPTNLGRSSAYRNLDPERSTLPKIQLKSDSQPNLRLLHKSGDMYYSFILSGNKDYPEIIILNGSQIHIIQGIKTVKKKSKSQQ